MAKKIVKKYAELWYHAKKASGRKEAISLIHEAEKLRNKYHNIQII